MTGKIIYRCLLMLVITGLAASCGGKRLNKRVSLWRNDKIPYGTWYAYNSLEHIFPGADVVINKRSPDIYKSYTAKSLKNVTEEYTYDEKKTVYLVITTMVSPDDDEVVALLNQVGKGRHIFISALSIGPNLLDSLRLEVANDLGFYNFEDSLTVSIDNPETADAASFSYPGFALDNYFSKMDSSITTVLGRDKKGRANFVKFSHEGGGAIFIHLAPLAFTNFFLLYNNNSAYYDNALSYLPSSAEVVRWDDYFRYHVKGDERNRAGGFSALGWISKQPPLLMAMLLLLLLLLIVYLFESKRRQRIIPVIAPLKNASLDFVKTIGRLYFQRRDNKNLAHKMTAHFMDHVRSRYNIRISFRDEEFEKRLSYKSGYDPQALRQLLYFLKYIQDRPDVNDDLLLELNSKLEHFYTATQSSHAVITGKKLQSAL